MLTYMYIIIHNNDTKLLSLVTIVMKWNFTCTNKNYFRYLKITDTNPFAFFCSLNQVSNLCLVSQNFMAYRAIPMIVFPWVRCMFIRIIIYIYILLCYFSEYASYTQLRKLIHSGGLGQLMGVACNRMRTQAPLSSRKKAACSFTSLCRNWN